MYQLQFLIASGFYSGKLPISGTSGSLLAYIIWYFALSQIPTFIQLGIIVIAFVVGIIVSNTVIAKLQSKDPSVIVWDEFVGSWISCLMLPNELLWLVISFVLFRFFDILKPFPVNWADQRLAGGLGVMTDDVFAGIYVFIILQLLLHLI